MIEFIISILVPILGGLGVSEADVTTYVTNCSGYIYAILISILVLIVLLVAAHFIAPKRKKDILVRWGASLAMGTRTCDHGKHGLLRTALHKPFRCIKRWRNSIR